MKELISVALPIGNPEDLSPRGRRAIEEADGVFAEDSRKFRDFARRAGLKIPSHVEAMPAFVESSEKLQQLFKKKAAERWVLVSDAGTPCINDPGSLLVRAARSIGTKVSAVPGPSAAILAVQLSGGFGNPILFGGFAPKKKKADFFHSSSQAGTFVFFESTHEVEKALSVLIDLGWNEQPIFLLRELSKTHEEVWSGSVAQLQEEILRRKSEELPLGELTFVLKPGQSEGSQSAFKAEQLVEFREAPPANAAKLLAKLCGITRDQAYEMLRRDL